MAGSTLQAEVEHAFMHLFMHGLPQLAGRNDTLKPQADMQAQCPPLNPAGITYR